MLALRPAASLIMLLAVSAVYALKGSGTPFAESAYGIAKVQSFSRNEQANMYPAESLVFSPQQLDLIRTQK